VAYCSVVNVPFTLIASARSFARASPIWFQSRLHPDRITAEKVEDEHRPLLVVLVLVKVPHTNHLQKT
jgi:hypothetical protein